MASYGGLEGILTGLTKSTDDPSNNQNANANDDNNKNRCIRRILLLHFWGSLLWHCLHSSASQASKIPPSIPPHLKTRPK